MVVRPPGGEGDAQRFGGELYRRRRVLGGVGGEVAARRYGAAQLATRRPVSYARRAEDFFFYFYVIPHKFFFLHDCHPTAV